MKLYLERSNLGKVLWPIRSAIILVKAVILLLILLRLRLSKLVIRPDFPGRAQLDEIFSILIFWVRIQIFQFSDLATVSTILLIPMTSYSKHKFMYKYTF